MDQIWYINSRVKEAGCLPGAGTVSVLVKNPLWVLDINPARAQTLFFCLQQDTEAWGEKTRVLGPVPSLSFLFFVVVPGRAAPLGEKSSLNPSFSENELT